MQVVKLISFAPFKNAAHALDEVNAISEAVLTDDLKNFLEVNLPKVCRGIHNAISSLPAEISRSIPVPLQHNIAFLPAEELYCLSRSQALPNQAGPVMIVTATAFLSTCHTVTACTTDRSTQVSSKPGTSAPI